MSGRDAERPDPPDETTAPIASPLGAAAIESCLTPIAIADGQLRLTYVNPAFVETAGAEHAGQLLGRSALIFAAAPIEALQAVDEARRTGRWVGHLEGRRLDGTPLQVLISIARVGGSAVPGETFVASVLDLTELRRAEVELRRRENERERGEQERSRLLERIRAIAREWTKAFDAIDLPVFLLRQDGSVRRLNRAAARLVPGGSVESINHTFREIERGEPWASAGSLVDEAIERNASLFREVRDPESRTTWHLAVSPSAPEDSRSPRWIVAIFRDVTRLYELQETVRRTEKTAAMGALVARVAHEVRNPLFGLSATVDALVEEHGEDERLSEYLEALRTGVERLGRMMGDVLDYGRPVLLETRRAELAGPLSAAITACVPIARSAGVALRSEIAPDLPALLCDVEKLEQAFQNLIENAIQHSPPNEQVVVRAALEGEPARLVVSVLDRGPGFGDEDPDRLVEPFFSQRPGGTGLGLWIVERVLAEHGGDLALREREGGGAVARARLPLPAR